MYLHHLLECITFVSYSLPESLVFQGKSEFKVATSNALPGGALATEGFVLWPEGKTDSTIARSPSE